MKKTTLLLAIVVLIGTILLSSSCDKIRKDKGIIASEPDMTTCFSPDNQTGEWVIRTQAEYDSLLATTACTSPPETIDFNTYTLLGNTQLPAVKASFSARCSGKTITK